MAEALAQGKVIAHRGEELARRVLPPGASAATVRATLQELLDAADAEVARREERLRDLERIQEESRRLREPGQ